MSDTALVWFRRDLRLADNPALTHALEQHECVIPLVVEPPAYAPGTGAGVWRSHSLAALAAQLEKRGAALWMLHDPAPAALAEFAVRANTRFVFANRAWDPESLAQESAVREALVEAGVTLHVTESAYLVPPRTLASTSGSPYRVFTPYFQAWQRAARARRPLPTPTFIPLPPDPPARTPVPTTSTPLHERWTPGEAGALDALASFAIDGLEEYDDARELPALSGTSMLSPHLAAGEITPDQALWAVQASGVAPELALPFVRQLAWREFSAEVLHAFPDLASRPLRAEFASMPWHADELAEERWKRGMTGYPLVDAGMRQLAETGWMHNRVRLVAASFLTKDLLLPWQHGERYFRETLVDYDPAQNAFNWQWVAGSGADAAPYFRIFNPTIQGQRFDPAGEYVRHWVPEIAALGNTDIHTPWNAKSEALEAAGIIRGETYPEPVIDHAEARARALAAYGSMRQA